MRILTVRQPWAWAIIHGGKDVENRKTNIAGDYRGPVAIIAGRADAVNAPEELWAAHADFYRKQFREHGLPASTLPTVRGHILGIVDLVDAHMCVGECSPWAMSTMPGPAHRDWWHLKFANPSPLVDPIPYRGSLGLRKLDDYTGALVSASLAASALRKFADDIANGGPR